jgi:hypothetical protein
LIRHDLLDLDFGAFGIDDQLDIVTDFHIQDLENLVPQTDPAIRRDL